MVKPPSTALSHVKPQRAAAPEHEPIPMDSLQQGEEVAFKISIYCHHNQQKNQHGLCALNTREVTGGPVGCKEDREGKHNPAGEGPRQPGGGCGRSRERIFVLPAEDAIEVNCFRKSLKPAAVLLRACASYAARPRPAPAKRGTGTREGSRPGRHRGMGTPHGHGSVGRAGLASVPPAPGPPG